MSLGVERDGALSADAVADSEVAGIADGRMPAIPGATGIDFWEYHHRTGSLLLRPVDDDSRLDREHGGSVDTMDDWGASIHPEDRRVFLTSLERCWSEGTPLSLELRARCRRGTWVPTRILGYVASRDASGAPLVSRGIRIWSNDGEQDNRLLRLQQKFTQRLADYPDRDGLVDAILDASLGLPELDSGALFWLRPDGVYELAASRGFTAEFCSGVRELAPDSVLGRMVGSGSLVCSCADESRICSDPRLVHDIRVASEGVVALTLQPILVAGRPQACLGVASKQLRQLPADTVSALGSLAAQFGQGLERLQAREEAASQRKNLETIMNSIQDFLFVLDADRRILYTNRAVHEVLGYGDSLIGRSCAEVRRPEIREEAARIIEEILAGRRSHCALPILKADGTEIPVDTRVVRSEWNGKPCVIAVARDVSDRQAAHKALEKERGFLSALVKTIPEMVWMKDCEGVYLTANPAVERFMGLGPGSLVGRTDADVFAPEIAGALRAKDRDAMQSSSPETVQEEIPNSEGRVSILETTKTSTYDSDGHLLGVLGVARDITERVRTEKELHRYRTQLEALVEARTKELERAREAADRANGAKSRFLSTMSHEIRTPLNAIMGFGQLLELDSALNEEQREAVGEILGASRHLLELINEVLDLSKIESGRIDLNFDSVDVSGVVDECCTLVRPLAEKQGIKMKIGDPTGQRVRADRARLKQILLNLLSNAIKYNCRGGWVRIGLGGELRGRCRISVSDSGQGIPEHLQTEVFEPFKRFGSECGDVEGSGIGQTITRRLVELMDGVIGLESGAEKGTTFWVEFPAWDGITRA